MGEIAEMMITGILCCQCGMALDEEVMEMEIGIPIICDGCFSELSDKDKKDFECRNESHLLKNK